MSEPAGTTMQAPDQPPEERRLQQVRETGKMMLVVGCILMALPALAWSYLQWLAVGMEPVLQIICIIMFVLGAALTGAGITLKRRTFRAIGLALAISRFFIAVGILALAVCAVFVVMTICGFIRVLIGIWGSLSTQERWQMIALLLTTFALPLAYCVRYGWKLIRLFRDPEANWKPPNLSPLDDKPA